MLYWMMRAAQTVAGALPRRFRWMLGGLVVQTVYWLWPAKRLATQKNMSVVLDLPLHHPQVRRTARLSWRNYGRYIGDFFDQPNRPASYYLNQMRDATSTARDTNGKLDTLIQLDQACAVGKGVLVTTGHYGNWDIAGVVVAVNTPLYILVEDLKDEKLNHLVQEQRRAFGMIVLPIENGFRQFVRLLRQGEVVATPIDRPLAPNEGIPVRFFDRTAYVPRALGALAVKLGCVIQPGFCWYVDGMQFQVRAFPMRIIERTGNDEADTIAATQIMFDALETMIRHDPTQWYMFRQFWPDATPTAAIDPAAIRIPVNAEAAHE